MNLTSVSVVICNRNSLNLLKKSIPRYKKIKFKELIVIDGISDDGSLEFLKKQGIEIISDEGKGLSYSRKLGTTIFRGNYLFIAGPDDICDKLFFIKLLKNFSFTHYDACTFKLKIFKPITYWDSSLNFWFSYIRNENPKINVIGTPTFFKKKVFKYVGYNKNTIGCDDTDISEQLVKNNFKIGVIQAYCNQVNGNKFEDIMKKFKLYGSSDINYYNFKNKKFNIRNFFNTLIHPFRHFLKFVYFLASKKQLNILPFALIITFYRYVGFFRK